MLNTMQLRLRNRKGFTLIELIVVIAIIAILAAVLIPRFTSFTDNARQRSATSDARNILLSVESILALEEATTIDQAAVEVFAGKKFDGDIKWASTDNTYNLDTIAFSTAAATFEYSVVISGTTYVVTVVNGVIE